MLAPLLKPQKVHNTPAQWRAGNGYRRERRTWRQSEQPGTGTVAGALGREKVENISSSAVLPLACHNNVLAAKCADTVKYGERAFHSRKVAAESRHRQSNTQKPMEQKPFPLIQFIHVFT